MNKKAFIYTVLTFIIALTIVVINTDYPIIRINKMSSKSIAALVIRDNVSAFQKWGSKLFTAPYLNLYYNESAYFTQYYLDDKKQDIISTLRNFLETNNYVDIYLLAHSNYYYEYIEEIEPELREKIRLVYNTGCGNFNQSEYWLSLGADIYISHLNEESLSPFFYFYFLRRWTKGYTLEDAVNISNNISINRVKNLSNFISSIKNNYNNLNPEAKLVIKQ